MSTYTGGMRVCILLPVLDAFKGGNHLPILQAMPDTDFTILTTRTKPANPELPPNVKIATLPPARLGPYYYGFADYRYASLVMRTYPPDHAFWRQFDVIHVNQVSGPAFLRLRHLPVLFLIHHPVTVDRQVALEETTGLEALLWRLRYSLLVRWQARAARSFPHLTTVSHTVAARLAQDYGVDERAVHILPNGVDGTRFYPGDLAQTEFDAIAIGSLIHPRKGFAHLLQVYRLLASRGYRIADVGRRTEKQQRALSAIPNLRSFAMVGHEQLLGLLQSSATLLSASVYEGFGLSLIEALACGRPCFAFDAGATAEVLRPIDPSLLVPIRDCAALADRVVRFLALPTEDRVAAGLAYREAALRHYGIQQSANVLRQLYGEIADHRPRLT